MEDDLFMMALFSREGEGGQFFCIDDANLAGDPEDITQVNREQSKV